MPRLVAQVPEHGPITLVHLHLDGFSRDVVRL